MIQQRFPVTVALIGRLALQGPQTSSLLLFEMILPCFCVTSIYCPNLIQHEKDEFTLELIKEERGHKTAQNN